MENSTAGKRKLRKRAQKRPLGDNEENGSCTKKRTGIDPKSSSASPDVDMKRRKTKRKASTRNNKKVCREENNAKITRENTQGLQNIPDDKEKFMIKYDAEIDKSIDGNILSDKPTDTKEEVENQTSVTNIQKSSSVPKGEESASPSNTQQTKYVPRFGKKRKRGIEEMQAAEPKEEEQSGTATNVDTVPTLPTDDNNLVQKHEDVAMISTVVNEEKKTSEDGVMIESTEIDKVETMSTEGTTCNVTGLSTSLEQEQKDTANTGNIIADEKDSVSETMIVNSTANRCDTSNQHASGGTIVSSTVQPNDSETEIMVTDTVPRQDEIKATKEDKACSPNNNTCGDRIMSSSVQASRSEPETTTVIKPQTEDNIAMEEEACCFPDNLSSQNSKPQTVQGSGDDVSAPPTEPNNNTNSAKEHVTKTEPEMCSGTVVEVARDVLSTIIEKIVTQEATICSSHNSSTQVTVSTESQEKEQRSEGGPEGDNNEKKVVQKADDSDTCDAQVTTQETVSAKSQGKEQVRPEGGTGTDTIKTTDGQTDDDPAASASDAQVATQETVFAELHGEEERSNGGGDDCGKKVEQRDGDSPATTASVAQQTRKTDEERTGQNSLQQTNEQKDSHLTNNSSEDKTSEGLDQEDSQGLDNFMDSLSSSQLYQMEQEALTTAQHINALPARQAPDEGARKAILGLTTDLACLNRSVMSVWREFNAVQKKRLARKKEQVAKASRAPPNAFRIDGITSQSVKIPQQGSNIHHQVLQQNPSPMKMGKDKKQPSSRGPPNVLSTDNIRRQHVQSGQQQNPNVMKIRNDKKVAFNKLDQQKKMDQHKIRPTSLQSLKNRQQGRLLPMPKPGTFAKNLTTSKLPFQGTTSQRQPGGISGLYQPNSSSRGYQHILPNRKPQNSSASTKGSSRNSFNFTPTKPAQVNSSVKMVGQQAAPPSRIEGSHNLMSCPSVNYRTYAR
ncbi:uncharacterized protein LOC144902273 isoform X2 [Branchiostoma floridae x Branchiostoma belcheri]